MILETSNPEFNTILKSKIPQYEKMSVVLIDDRENIVKARLAWSADGEIMVMGRGRRRYGSHFNKSWWKAVKFPEKRNTKKIDKWTRSWTNVLNRLENSGLWEDYAKDVRLALAIGEDKIVRANKQYWEHRPNIPYGENDKLNAEAIKNIDERLIKYRDDGTIYPDTNIIWYMDNYAKVKKMRFGRKWLNDRELADIANAMKNKEKICTGTNGRITGGYDVHFEYNPETNKAWYSEEYRGCGNGHYYLALDATHALFYEDD